MKDKMYHDDATMDSNWETPHKKTGSKAKTSTRSAHTASGTSKSHSTSGASKSHSSKSTGTTASKSKKSTGHTAHKPATGSSKKSNLYNNDEYILVEEIIMIEEEF